MKAYRLAALSLALTAAAAIASDKDHYGGAKGYLPDGIFSVISIVPLPPVAGDARDKADRKVFKQTRKMIGDARYRLATDDAVINPAALMKDFSCAVGVALTPRTAPRTAAVGTRAAIDTGIRNSDAKDMFKRRRPFLVDKGEICQPREQLAGSFDYPSGHTSYGWTWGYVLADALPDRAADILARARAYGESRFICGAHNLSAVEAGAVSAAATMSVVRQTAGYQADLAASRAELRALLANPAAPRPTGCDAERALVAQRVP